MEIKVGSVTLEVSEWGRPIIYIADYHYKCLPGTAVEYVSNSCIFSSREQAIRWAKFEMRDEIDWSTWISGTDKNNYDNEELNPTFVATIEREVFSQGTILKRVTVRRTEVSEDFDWWAKTADGNWNSPPSA